MLGLLGITPKSFIKTVSGWPGLGAVFVYSYLVAVALPFPGELVLFVPIHLGTSHAIELAVVILVSSVGKTFGGVSALVVEERAESAAESNSSGQMPDWLVFDVDFDFDFDLGITDWFERQTVRLVKRWGYVGLTAMLAIPGAPDTVSIYAFTVIQEDTKLFAAAAFAGSVGRLLITLALIRGILSLSIIPGL